jgi:hypothetical protein
MNALNTYLKEITSKNCYAIQIYFIVLILVLNFFGIVVLKPEKLPQKLQLFYSPKAMSL